MLLFQPVNIHDLFLAAKATWRNALVWPLYLIIIEARKIGWRSIRCTIFPDNVNYFTRDTYSPERVSTLITSP
ncbi:hypothetical protein ONQ60_25960, partial [Salmonella enterica subsp. enterica serovar Virginia]|nr:hypothetical protein [Salmonella enterica subsp. enterica serovar Virginia]